MLSEIEVRSKWRMLFGNGATPRRIQEARQLVRQLRPESPLRSRLAGELDEIRRLQPPRRKK